jgi:hypothetical protein
MEAFWILRDFVFPLAEPLSREDEERSSTRLKDEQTEWEDRASALKVEELSLERYVAACKAAIEDERKRQQSVEARLTAVLGFSSIAGTIVFGTMLTNMHRAPGLLDWLILILLAYLTLQVASALLASVRGLERRSYLTMDAWEILPRRDEARTDHLRRAVQQSLPILAQNREENNAKVTQMAVAHRAIANLIGGILVLAILGAFRLAMGGPDEWFDRLRSDPNLRELIRGPK